MIKMSKTIEVFYDIDYGIFTVKTVDLGLSKTRIDQLQRLLQRTINNFLKI